MNSLDAHTTEELLWLKAQQSGLSRRRFLQLFAMGGTAAVLSACKNSEAPVDKQDCIIVGSGPIGIAAAIRLAGQGLRVLVLEAGKAITDPASSHFRNQPVFQEDPDSYFDAIGPYLLPLGDQPNSVLPGLADSRLRGGQGIIWTNNCPRAEEFERWTALSPDEWEQRYAEAEAMLQVLSDLASGSQTGANIKTRLESVLTNGRSIIDLPLSGRFLDGGSIYFNAPWDLLNSASTEIMERIEIRSETEVTRIIWENDRVRGVDIAGPNNIQERLETTALLLAGGAVGSPQLLYRSEIRPEALGQGFSFHALLFGQVVLDPALTPPASEADLTPRLYIPPTVGAPWHIQVLRDTFPVPATEVVNNPHRLLEFQAFSPIEYRDENRFVFKDNNEIEVQFALSEKDQMQIQAMEQDVRDIAAHLGPWRGGGGEIGLVPQGTAHLVGTCRMDLPDWEGVADAQGRVHGFKNLYLASVGLIPAPVAVNPTLTAVALALNTADVLLEEM